MIDKCEICFVSTSTPVEHYPYWVVCSDCDNDLWKQSGSKPLSDNKCDVCRDELTEHSVTDKKEQLCHTCWQKKEDLINYGDDV